MIRQPAVAGQFYPASAEQVTAQLNDFIHPVAEPQAVIAIVVPHAGWMYSGATAGTVFSHVRIPDCAIMVGPNHHGVGADYAIFGSGEWRTPVGNVSVDDTLAKELLARCKWFAADASAHAVEHSLEVEVPMLLRVNSQLRIVPILIGGGWPESGGRAKLREIGAAIAQAVQKRGQRVLLLASSDLNHYEDQETSNRKDKLALDAVARLDEDALMDCVHEHDISMCGAAPTYIVIHAAKKLGATRAEVLDYRTSGDVTGDFSSVVGYGGVMIA